MLAAAARAVAPQAGAPPTHRHPTQRGAARRLTRSARRPRRAAPAARPRPFRFPRPAPRRQPTPWACASAACAAARPAPAPRRRACASAGDRPPPPGRAARLQQAERRRKGIKGAQRGVAQQGCAPSRQGVQAGRLWRAGKATTHPRCDHHPPTLQAAATDPPALSFLHTHPQSAPCPPHPLTLDQLLARLPTHPPTPSPSISFLRSQELLLLADLTPYTLSKAACSGCGGHGPALGSLRLAACACLLARCVRSAPCKPAPLPSRSSCGCSAHTVLSHGGAPAAGRRVPPAPAPPAPPDYSSRTPLTRPPARAKAGGPPAAPSAASC